MNLMGWYTEKGKQNERTGAQETACRDKNDDGRGFMGLNGGVRTMVLLREARTGEK